MDSNEKDTLLLLTQFARRPGVRLYHYSTLATLDDKFRPYNRLRSPTVIRPFEILMEEIDKQISGEIPTRYTKERLEEVRVLDIKYKNTIDKHAWQFVFLEEIANKNHIKKSLNHLKNNNHAHLVCMEALVVMSPQGLTIQRGTNDLIFDLKLDTIENRGQQLYDHRTGRYMLLLADTHLASYDDKETRYYETVFDIWTANYTSQSRVTQSEKGPIEILTDFQFTNKQESLMFLKKHNMGTIAIKDPKTNKAFSIPTRFIVDESIAKGVFWLVDDKQEWEIKMYNKIVQNISSNDPHASLCCPAFGMQHELGISLEGDLTTESAEINAYKAKTGYQGSIIFITPHRITNISTPEDRRGKIVYSDWD
ncbi:MAG: hypothetical protein ACFFAU_05885 [Candidatus Hodarchaeota archaeon]